MNRIIKGKRYDTETAKEIGYISGGAEFANDFNFWCETLFQKRTGEFFLYCEGGANSRYGHWEGDSGGWGEKIVPMPVKKAQEWAEENLTGDEYEKIFGKIEEGKKFLSASISARAHDKLKKLAIESGISASEMLERLIDGAE